MEPFVYIFSVGFLIGGFCLYQVALFLSMKTITKKFEDFEEMETNLRNLTNACNQNFSSFVNIANELKSEQCDLKKDLDSLTRIRALH